MDFYFLLHKGGGEREREMSEGKLIHDIIGELFIQKELQIFSSEKEEEEEEDDDDDDDDSPVVKSFETQ